LTARSALASTGATHDATAPGGDLPTVGPDATLREVLSVLLEGAPRAIVADNGRDLGSLAFDDVRAALARTER
jgi:CBS domain-containing protein